MANGATTEVRDQIGAFLAGREGWGDWRGRSAFYWEFGCQFMVFLDAERVHVKESGQPGYALNLPADAPDLLVQLDATLTKLGV